MTGAFFAALFLILLFFASGIFFFGVVLGLLLLLKVVSKPPIPLTFLFLFNTLQLTSRRLVTDDDGPTGANADTTCICVGRKSAISANMKTMLLLEEGDIGGLGVYK